LTPVRAPQANAIAERVIGTMRRECCDHVIVWNARHLRRVLAESVRFDNDDRPHRALDLEPPNRPAPVGTGPIMIEPILGGLHHVYRREV
jgi:transposase InsO family protein